MRRKGLAVLSFVFISLAPLTVAAEVEAENASVETRIDPAIVFTISGRSSSCNGETQTGSSTGSAAVLGHANAGAPVSAAQDLRIESNAAFGWNLYSRVTGQLSDGQGHTIPHTSAVGPAAFPATGTAAFAVAYDWMASNTWYQPTSAPSEVFNDNGSSWLNFHCVAYQAQVDSTTPSGNYSTTVIWTLVPRF